MVAHKMGNYGLLTEGKIQLTKSDVDLKSSIILILIKHMENMIQKNV